MRRRNKRKECPSRSLNLAKRLAKNFQCWPPGVKQVFKYRNWKGNTYEFVSYGWSKGPDWGVCKKSDWEEQRRKNREIDDLLLNGVPKVFYAGFKEFSRIKEVFKVKGNEDLIQREYFTVHLDTSLGESDIISEVRKV